MKVLLLPGGGVSNNIAPEGKAGFDSKEILISFTGQLTSSSRQKLDPPMRSEELSHPPPRHPVAFFSLHLMLVRVTPVFAEAYAAFQTTVPSVRGGIVGILCPTGIHHDILGWRQGSGTQ